jgi:MtN3 and saliva related transmembrane protein
MTFLATLATVVGIAMGLSGVPQAIKIFRRKSAHDIAAISYLILNFGAIVWIFYGLEIKSLPVVLSNGVGMVTSTTILIGCYLYGRTKQ